MSRTPKRFVVCSVCLVMLVCVTSSWLISGASVETSALVRQDSAPASVNRGPRNFSLQPEALRVARRLGKRFDTSSRAESVLTGTVTTAGSEKSLTITRRQSEKGENIELMIAGRALVWDAQAGARAVSGTLTETERRLIERLIYDSADYFVLAQLRGAVYYTVARNLRPDNAPENYDGPLWTLVRVEEPPSDEPNTQLVSRWRLFYLNSITGLIDKIITEEQGQPIEASFSTWKEQSTEKFPATITWTSSGQTLMTFNLASLSTAAH